MPAEGRLRVAVVWKQLSGYAAACFRALAERADVLLVHRAATPNAPYDDGPLRGELPGHGWDGAPDLDRLRREVEAFGPHALLVSSWNVGAYRRLARELGGRALRVLCMDNPWLGTSKQWAGRLAAPAVIRPAFDAVFVPGERQLEFARRLGFGADRVLWGLYTCDHAAFAAAAREPLSRRPPGFLFVGRLAPEKGVDVLAAAYRAYRSEAGAPWPLVTCGTGPLAGVLGEVPGVEPRGFVQPGDLPAAFGQGRCLVLPSTFEPWGVVVHEAASAGLAVVCTTACGASTRLVLDGYNGEVVPPGDAAALAAALARVSGLDPAGLDVLGSRSTQLAAQFTPERWAAYLASRLPALARAVGVAGP